MLTVIAIVLATLSEAYRNHVLINQRKDPHNWWTYSGRFIGLTLIAALVPGTFEYFWETWISSFFIFWFFFDYSLNLMRGKELIYLSDKGIDKLQTPHIAWFWFKLALASGAIQTIIKPSLLYGGN